MSEPTASEAESRGAGHHAWLLLLLPAGLMTYCVAAEDFQYCCSTGDFIIMSLLLPAAGLGALAAAGASGRLDRSLVRGAKVWWAISVSALLWSALAILGVAVVINQSRPGINPIFGLSPDAAIWVLLVAVVGFVVSSCALWFVLFLGDTLRHAIKPQS